MEIVTNKEEIKLKYRLVAGVLTLFLLTGCANVLDKVTKKNPNPVQPTITNNAGKTIPETQTKAPEDLSLQDVQAALKDAKSVKLVAQDSGQSLALDTARREILIKNMADAGELKETQELALLVANPEFPAYQILIEDKNLKLDIYDSLHFGYGENSRHYFMEKGEIWKNLTKWLPPLVYAENQTGYLFKATKMTVKGGNFTEETDQTVAKNAVLRKIRAANLQKTTLPKDAADPLVLTFTVNGTKLTMKIYDDYVTYHDFVYKFDQGKKEIETLLSQQ